MRVSYQTEDPTRTYQHLSTTLKLGVLQMGSVAMLIGGALVNALAFSPAVFTCF